MQKLTWFVQKIICKIVFRKAHFNKYYHCWIRWVRLESWSVTVYRYVLSTYSRQTFSMILFKNWFYTLWWRSLGFRTKFHTGKVQELINRRIFHLRFIKEIFLKFHAEKIFILIKPVFCYSYSRLRFTKNNACFCMVF